MTPQLILTLSPSGQLVLERPMAGSRQTIPIAPGTLESTAKRILLAQLCSESHLGQDGLPTTAQVNHWNRHANHIESGCSFCQSEQQQMVQDLTNRARRQMLKPVKVGNGTATVRHIPPSPSDRKAFGLKLTTHLSIDDLEL